MQLPHLALLALSGAAAAAATADAHRLPNVVFVLADDMGMGDVMYNSDLQEHPGAGNTSWTFNGPHTPGLNALATGKGSIRFNNWYAGAPICSPTRSSVLTGRTPQRECIDTAEGCGQEPAWSCYDKLPMPLTTYTVAEAAQAKGYATFFAGKWHLGEFWDKAGEPGPKSFAMKKWPASHPGMHGFDVWHATEASAESSTPNCGCVPEWQTQGQGCIVGGGAWTKKASLDCTNYWRYAEAAPKAACSVPATTTRDCVANLTEKIEGDDSEYIMDTFEGWLNETLAAKKPFFAFLWLHTNHVPHFALPEWYHKYKDVNGDWAGDYLGTISQMDAQMARLQAMLAQKGVEDNTMVWFTADNGAHTEKRPNGQLAASNGLRQCKASIFEGGLRVPGFVRWPAGIAGAVSSNYLVGTNDFLPTMLDVWGMDHPHPTWAADGVSILPVLQGTAGAQRPKKMPFSMTGQQAIVYDEGEDGVWKIVRNPLKGQCDTMLPPWNEKKVEYTLLFRIDQDPIEEVDLCHAEAARCAAYKADLAQLTLSISDSRVHESACSEKSGDFAAALFERPEAVGGATGAQYQADAGCLGVQWIKPTEVLEVGSCSSPTSHWDGLSNVNLPGRCLVLEHGDCRSDDVVLLEDCAATGRRHAGLAFDKAGRLASAACPGMCAQFTKDEGMATLSSSTVSLGGCGEDALVFSL